MRLLVSEGEEGVVHGAFPDLPTYLRAGDALVVNTSATVPAAISATLEDCRPVRVHFSTELPGGLWLVEARQPAGDTTSPMTEDLTGDLRLDGGGRLSLLERFPGSHRLWIASAHLPGTVLEHLATHGEPIRYRHARERWPLSAYQQIFGHEPGSAEMPSAARPFTADLVVELVRRGVTIVPILLHTGVSSLEGNEMPYPERYRVSESTRGAAQCGARECRASDRSGHHRGAGPRVGHRRARHHPSRQWMDRARRHARTRGPRGRRSSHGLARARGDPPPHARSDRWARARSSSPTPRPDRAGYLWHEFGDTHLLLPDLPLRGAHDERLPRGAEPARGTPVGALRVAPPR